MAVHRCHGVDLQSFKVFSCNFQFQGTMVREIVHLQVGQCGNQIGNIFWNTTCDEHHLDSKGYFRLNKKDKVTHRSAKQVPETDADDEKKEASSNPNPSRSSLSPYDQILIDKIGVYYEEVDGKQRKYTPRAVLVDLEPGTLDKIKANRIGHMFKPDNFVFGHNGCSNNWAKGRFTEGTVHLVAN